MKGKPDPLWNYLGKSPVMKWNLSNALVCQTDKISKKNWSSRQEIFLGRIALVRMLEELWKPKLVTFNI